MTELNIRRTTLASASWADCKVAEKALAIRYGQLWIGRSETENAEPLGHMDDRHVMLVAGNRAGKFASFQGPNAIGYSGSAVFIDQKGEIADVTARRRGKGSPTAKGLEQEVFLFDPLRVSSVDDSYRIGFNPLDMLVPGSPDIGMEAAEMSAALIPTSPAPGSEFWVSNARSALKAVSLHVRTAPYIHDEDRNLVTVRQLLMRGDFLSDAMSQTQNDEVEPVDLHQLLWLNIASNKSCGDLLPGLGSRFLAEYMNAPKQYTGTLSTILAHTDFIEDDARMAAALSKTTSGFRLEDLKESPKGISLYICLPLYATSSQSGLLRLFVTLITRIMAKQNFQPKSGHPVLMMIDEFASLKHLDSLADGIANLAGYGLKLFIALQSLEQLQTHYPKHYHTFLANMGIKIFLGVEDPFTSEQVSKFLGETEVVRATSSITLTDGTTITQGETFTISDGVTVGTSDTTTDGWNSGWNESQSSNRSEGHNYSTSKSTTTGQNGSESRHWGSTSGPNGSSSRGGAISRGWSFATTNGESRGWSVQNSFGRTAGASGGQSGSNSVGNNRSTNTSKSEAEQMSRGISRSMAQGRTETVHVRPLLQPHEVQMEFRRIDETQADEYPGKALVMITGERPLTLKRVNYYEDPCFVGYFDKHPHHPMKLVRKLTVCLGKNVQATLKWRSYTLAWAVTPGARVLRGQTLGVLTAKGKRRERDIEIRAINDGTIESLHLPDGPAGGHRSNECYVLLTSEKTARSDGPVTRDVTNPYRKLIAVVLGIVAAALGFGLLIESLDRPILLLPLFAMLVIFGGLWKFQPRPTSRS